MPGNAPQLLLPPLSEGMAWHAMRVELRVRPGHPSSFFPDPRDAGGQRAGGGFISICLPAENIRDALDRVEAFVEEEDADLADIQAVWRVEDIADLPEGDGQMGLDDAMEEAFSDPDLGEEVVRGVIYLYPAEGGSMH